MAYRTMPLLGDHDPAIQPSRHTSPILTNLPLAKQHLGFDLHFFDGAQPRDDTLFVEERVGVADAAPEVGFQVFDRKSGGHEIERCAGGEAGAMAREEVECGRPVGCVGWRRGKVEREENVVDGMVVFIVCGWGCI